MKGRDPASLIQGIEILARDLDAACLMEVCGTHTVSLFRTGVKSLLPGHIRMKSGPGCPVCVTPQGYIDAALDAAARPGTVVCTYGDMVRVPGRRGSLEEHRSQGAEVMVCYSIFDSLRRAEEEPHHEVLFLAVGFETTAPATALALIEAERKGLSNFSILNGHKRVMPALSALLSGGDVPVDGFLLPGHVSVIIGSRAYAPLVERFNKACVIAGFEPSQLLLGIEGLLSQLKAGAPRLENVYGVAVRPEGNTEALARLDEVFEAGDTVWRALGTLPGSGMTLRERFQRFDAATRFDLRPEEDYEPPGCRCGEVIQGRIDPPECPLFGKTCTTDRPVGPCMVSSEGTCAAWYRYAGIALTG